MKQYTITIEKRDTFDIIAENEDEAVAEAFKQYEEETNVDVYIEAIEEQKERCKNEKIYYYS